MTDIKKNENWPSGRDESVKRIRNWTIPPVYGKSPEELYDGCLSTFPRIRGDVVSHRRIGRAWEKCPEGQCGESMPVDIMTSCIENVSTFDKELMPPIKVIQVTTKTGTVYQLEGEPRPSFAKHCEAFGVDPQAETAVAELVFYLQG